MPLTLRQLKIFTAVADAGSTTAAAERLFLSQSATSAAVKELEHLLDAQLFDRVGKALILNDSGRLLLPQARQLLDGAEMIERQFADGGAQLPALRIGASTTIGNYLLPHILAALRNAQPSEGDMLPRVTIANTAEIVAAVESFDVDIGLIEGSCHASDLHAEPWICDPMVVVAAADHPLRALAAGRRDGKVPLKALRGARWLLREPGSGTREAVEHALIPHLHALPAAGELSNAEAIKHAAAAGLGLACLSRFVVDDLLAAGRLAELPTTLPPIERRFYLVFSRKKLRSARLDAFLAFCREWGETQAGL